MSYIVLTGREREELVDLFLKLQKRGEKYPQAKTEALTALRCLKAIHSNAIEDKRVDRIFLQLLLHNAGIDDKSSISVHYHNAAKELKGQEATLLWLEDQSKNRTELSISMLLEMHRMVFEDSTHTFAGKFRQGEVRISHTSHLPPHHTKIQETLFQEFKYLNEKLASIGDIDRESFFDVLKLSAEAHYMVAHVHPFEDGNGRIARAIGDYVMLCHGFYYDVIMTDYRDTYLDALDACILTDTTPLYHFIEYSYLETLRRIAGFFQMAGEDRLMGAA